MKKLLLILFVLFFSNVFADWIPSLNGRSVWSFGLDKQKRFYAGGLTGSNSRIWRMGFNRWDTIYVGSGQTMWGFAFDTIGTYGNMYVANYSDGLLKSTNGGINFTTIDVSHFMGKNPQGVACTKSGNIFVNTASGFFRSTNGGVSFDTALTGLNCVPILIDGGNQNIIYVGVSSGSGTGAGFYRSTNGGITFSENLNPGKNCYGLYQGAYGLFQITTTSPYNFDRSTDRGLTWTTAGNAPNAMRGIASEFGNLIYIGGNGGVYHTVNNGFSWFNLNLAGSVTPLIIHSNRVWAGVSGTNAGIYYYTIPDDIQNNQSTLTTKDFTLYQNYPNPFNPNTKIIYELKRANHISLKIYDALGNEIKEIDNGFKNAGRHEINFSGENLASGLYFARLNVNETTLTSRLVLVK